MVRKKKRVYDAFAVIYKRLLWAYTNIESDVIVENLHLQRVLPFLYLLTVYSFHNDLLQRNVNAYKYAKSLQTLERKYHRFFFFFLKGKERTSSFLFLPIDNTVITTGAKIVALFILVSRNRINQLERLEFEFGIGCMIDQLYTRNFVRFRNCMLFQVYF